MIIEKLSKRHIENAAKLVSDNYRNVIKNVPILPNNDYNKQFSNSINWLVENYYGVVALQENEVIGFLSGMAFDSFKGLNRGIYCPIYAHGAGGDKQTIYQRMYENIADIWVKNVCLTHAITVFAHEEETVNTWFNLGFGKCCIDAIRLLSNISCKETNQYFIRQATEIDSVSLPPLFVEHDMYYCKSPLFMPVLKIPTLKEVNEFLSSDDEPVWVAIDSNKKAVAIMKTDISGETFVAEDISTINLRKVYLISDVRGTGLAATMLNTIIHHFSDKGYERLGVDYESFNILGSRFWEKHFTPYTCNLVRKLDERITWANSAINNDTRL